MILLCNVMDARSLIFQWKDFVCEFPFVDRPYLFGIKRGAMPLLSLLYFLTVFFSLGCDSSDSRSASASDVVEVMILLFVLWVMSRGHDILMMSVMLRHHYYNHYHYHYHFCLTATFQVYQAIHTPIIFLAAFLVIVCPLPCHLLAFCVNQTR